MSEFTEILSDLVADRASATTDPILNLSTGKTFYAEIDDISDPVLLMTELGEDVREATMLHVTDDAQALAINCQDLVQFHLYGNTVTMQVIKRRNNPTSPQTDFWCVAKVAGKDT